MLLTLYIYLYMYLYVYIFSMCLHSYICAYIYSSNSHVPVLVFCTTVACEARTQDFHSRVPV